MERGLVLYVFHIAVTWIIESVIDDFLRRNYLGGIMRGLNLPEFVPLCQKINY